MEQDPCKIYYCYKATNDVNGKTYIGFAGDPLQRWREHKRDAEKGRGYIFHEAIRKYGWDHFQFEVICCGKDKQVMLEYVEPILIDQYHSSIGEHGYNIHRKVLGASFSNKSRSLETRRKMSEAQRGRPAHNRGSCASETTKKKMSAAHVGKISPRKGKSYPKTHPMRYASCHPVKYFCKGLCRKCYNHKDFLRRRLLLKIKLDAPIDSLK
jgi:group I intron endonuclease